MDTFGLDNLDDLTKDDIILIGIPSDYGSIYDIGTKGGPKAVREASKQYSGVNYEKTHNFHDYNVVDFGDIKNYNSLEMFLNEIRKTSEIISECDAYPIYIGGNHLITYPIIKGIKKPKGQIGIIWIDSHLDFMNEYPEGKKYTIATPLRRIIEIQNFRPDNIAIIGVHGNTQGVEEIRDAKASIPSIYSMEYIEKIGIDKLMEILKNQFSDIEYLHITLDVDAIDPAFAPAVSVPEPGGFTSREILKIIRFLSPLSNGLDIVEYNPSRDLSQITAKLVCSIIIENIIHLGINERR
ncbi:MAG: hypothetical protein GF329_05515 [Candidatus Lokiarchaeota archaeon]|nr:hypothetical protein [Candidatus Lokiarchaeota archaeon]